MPPTEVVTVAPPVEEAMTALARRTVRAIVFFFVRLVGVGILMTVIELQFPAIARVRIVFEAFAGMIVLLPFFTSLGRAFAWRIALGAAYVRESRWNDADRALSVFEGGRARLFDAAGEGAYWLGVARRGLGSIDDARRIWSWVAANQRGPWAERAAAEVTSLP